MTVRIWSLQLDDDSVHTVEALSLKGAVDKMTLHLYARNDEHLEIVEVRLLAEAE